MNSPIKSGLLGLSLSMSISQLAASPLTLENVPLFTTNAVNPNLILTIDDSGSMESEVLFPTNDGALWWNTTDKSFISSNGVLNFNDLGSHEAPWKKFTYLFPNGTEDGARIYEDDTNFHYAVPPLPQFAYARSSEFNKMYYNPNETYLPWPSEGSDTFSDINATAAPSDPVTGITTLNLSNDRISSASNETFRVYSGLVIPTGTIYADEGSSSWNTLSANLTVPSGSVSDNDSIGIRYYPATYYNKVDTGTYTVNGTSGNCASPSAAHYILFRDNPDTLSSVDALGPDGTCLEKVEIKSGASSYSQDGSRSDCASASSCTYAEEMQNFANWYSYYRKRHLALRAGMGEAFTNMTSMRTGIFTINDVVNNPSVTMWDLDDSVEQKKFFDFLYDIDGNKGGTPNREALDYAGQQYKRTDTDAPIIEACQKNFTLLFTDGFASLSGTLPTSTADNSSGAPYQDSYDDTLADIAMEYYDNILALALVNSFTSGQVPTPAGCSVASPDPMLDCNTDLHMNTYTVGLGAKGTLFGVTHNKVADAYITPTPTWPDVNGTRDSTQIDDLYHAAVNGRGEMFNADSASDLQTQLRLALSSVQASIGVASSVTFNTSTLETDSRVFLAFFNSSNWTGDLVSFDLDGQGNVDLAATWSAGSLLDAATPSYDTRTVITYDDTSGSETGAPFRWANLNTSQLADLNAAPGGNGSDALNFIRGDRSNEASRKFRVRSSALGDIVNGAPIFVGTPDLGWPSFSPFPEAATGTTYSAFRSTFLTTPRTSMTYYGGNDGMLHGVDATTGEEKLAYIPAYLYSSAASEGLHYLADPTYQHRYYVDLQPTVSDIYIDRNASGTDAWHTILIGGSRAGGKGLFALDITDPTNFSEANAASIALWEFTDPDLGYTYSKPTIAMMENGEWAAIFGNGYNDTGTGVAKLFILFIEKGLDGSWTAGTDYLTIATPVTSTTTTPNGLGTPAVIDLDGNGAADRVYAGDLDGNLWAFDLSDSNESKWEIAHSTGSGGGKVYYPLFTATDANGNTQPITSRPTVAIHPDPPTPSTGTYDPNLLIMFGTGKYLELTDLTTNPMNPKTQSFYGVWDNGQSTSTSTNSFSRSDLIAQTFVSGNFADSDGRALRVLTDTTIDYTANSGWLIDLPTLGERVVVNPHIRGTLVFFNTWIPSSTACDSGGSGFLMSVELLNGGEPDRAAFDITGDGVVDTADVVTDVNTNTTHSPSGQEYNNGLPASSAFLSNKQYTPGTGSNVIEVRDVQDLGDSGTGRLSWQQLFAD